MTHYTLIAYRSNHVDTCRGCVMDSSSSTHDISHHIDFDKVLVKTFAIWKFTEGRSKYAEPEFTLLIDGLDSNHYYAKYEHTDVFDAFEEKLEKAKTEYLEEKRRAAEVERERESRQREQLKADTEKREREQLRALKAKYPEE